MIKQIVKKVLLSINALFSISLVFGIIGAYISPQQIPYLVLPNLALPYLLIINLLFMILWIFLKNKYFLISTLSIIAAAPLISNTLPLSASKNNINHPNPIKLMSYNVRVFDLYNWSNNKVTRNKMFQFIRNESPQIACFQEFFNNKNSYFPVHDSLIKNQHFNYSHIHYNIEINNGHQFGIATYSCYPIINEQAIEFNNSLNLAIISDIKIHNDTIRVINCHLESVRFMVKDYNFIDSVTMLSENRRIEGFKGLTTRLLLASQKRAVQAEQISSLAQKSPFPTIICGDFNDTPYSYTYTTVSSKLNDSFKKHPFGLGGTFNRFIMSLRIDYIFHNSTIKCNELKTEKVSYSDHFPIIGSYSISK